MDEIENTHDAGDTGAQPSEPNWQFGPRPELTSGAEPLSAPREAFNSDVFDDEAYEAQQAAHRQHRNKTIKVGLAFAAAAALIGAGIGHFAWSSDHDGSGSNDSTNSSSPFSGTSGQDNDGQNGTEGTSASAATQAIASKVTSSLVDINTNLGYQDEQAAGTGIVLSSTGLILTNNHVIAGSTSISATDLGNNKTYTAVVVGYDKSQDIAVLQLQDASGLTVASFGNSNTVAVGQAIVGVGNAGGKGGTPSAAAGTVVAINQSITASDESSSESEQLSGLIQTNADIQPGDSGGPLVNMNGKIIGMDTAASSSYSFSTQGTEGFSIPINQALSLAHQITSGKASSTVHIGETGFLGVKVIATGQQGFGFGSGATGNSGTASSGAEVSGVVSGSPAATAGLGAGAVITSLNGSAVTTPDSLTQLLAGFHPGDTVSLGWTDANGVARTSQIALEKGPAA